MASTDPMDIIKLITQEAYKQSHLLTRMTIAFIILLALTFLMRVYTRLRLVRVWESEDWVMVIAVLFGFLGACFVLADVPITNEILDKNYEHEALGGRLILTTVLFLVISDVATRISFGYFYLNIFGHKHRVQRWFIWASMLACLLCGIPTFILFLVSGKGQPSSIILGVMYRHKGVEISVLIYGVVIILSDFGLIVMGLIALARVRIPILAKVPAAILFIIQCASGIATVARIVYSARVHRLPVESSLVTVLVLSQWTLVEASLGLITANLALTRPLFVVMYRFFAPKKSAAMRRAVADTERKQSGWDFASRGSFEITKTQVITVVNEDDMDLGDFEGMGRAGLIGENWGLEVSRT